MKSFNAETDISEEMRQKCYRQIEKGMSYCDKCETETVDEIRQACTKHRKMFARITK